MTAAAAAWVAAAAAVAAPDSPTTPALIPWPSDVAILPGPPLTLSSKSNVVFASPSLASAASVLAADLADIHGLAVTTRQGATANPGDVLLRLAPSLPPPPPSPPASPPPPPPPPPPAHCTNTTSGVKLNNTVYTDGNGPRESTGPDDCCTLCAQAPNCVHWTYSVDPAFPGPYPKEGWCRWAHLTHCCWLHPASGGGDLIADKHSTTGLVPPPPPPPVMPESLPAAGIPGFPSTAYNLTVTSDGPIVVEATTVEGVLTGTATLVQATGPPINGSAAGGPVAVPLMTVADQPFRGWRGLQVDIHGNPYHSMWDFKRLIRLARYFKHNTLSLNIGPSEWISPVMASTALMNDSWRAGKNSLKVCYNGRCVMYSEEEMGNLIAYGAARGVHLIPCTGLMPGDSELAHTINTTMVPEGSGYKFHDWVDEVDGLGPSTYNGTQDGPTGERFWAWMEVVLGRVYKLFMPGWPNGVIPTWHVMAVEGEGGMTGPMLRSMFDRIQKAAKAVHGPGARNVTVGFYTGLPYDDPAIADVRTDLVNHWYDPANGIENFLDSGWNVVSLSWAPLYICPGCFNGLDRSGPYEPQTVFDKFNLFYISDRPPVGDSPNATYLKQYWVPGRESQTLGAIMSTWEIGVTCQGCDEFSYVRERAGAFAEHAWSYRRFPYPTTGPGSWDEFKERKAATDLQLDKLVWPLGRNFTCQVNPHDHNKTECVFVPNGNGTHYLANCGGVRETAPPWMDVCVAPPRR